MPFLVMSHMRAASTTKSSVSRERGVPDASREHSHRGNPLQPLVRSARREQPLLKTLGTELRSAGPLEPRKRACIGSGAIENLDGTQECCSTRIGNRIGQA